MGKVARPRIVTKERLDTTGLPEHVQVVLAEIAGAAREGVLALSGPRQRPSRAAFAVLRPS